MATTKEKKSKAPSIVSATWIRLQIPNELYYAIKDKAEKHKRKTGNKKNMDEQCIDDLYKANPTVKK